MKKKALWALIILLVAVSCRTVPVTGRQQLDLVGSDTLLALSFSEYDKFLKQHKVITKSEDAAMVRRTGQRIQKAVEKYFSENKMSRELKGYKWEFTLVEDKAVNAWCMPGGKVVVYTGILPVTKNEAGLAVVMGHEIAHAVANHGGERMSQGLLAEMGGVALSVALSSKPSETSDLFLLAYGVGTTVGVLLPYSRMHETEADHLGLVFMAMAGYDPRVATDFWRRMAESKKGASVPEFLSTHPADSKRIKNLEKLMPEAMKYYREK